MLKSQGPRFDTPLGEIRLYQCPKCHAEWFEFVDASDYPESCPHCQADFCSNEDDEEPDSIGSCQ